MGYDCVYCVSRRSSNVRRARFTVDEAVQLTLDLYRRNCIEGLFLSSGIARSEDETMLDLVRVAQIPDCSKRGGIILDAFAGSGTTLLAAEKTGRHGYGLELDPHYYDLIIKRFEEVYGLGAIHLDSDLSFDQVRADRMEHENDDEEEDTNKVRINKTRRQKASRQESGREYRPTKKRQPKAKATPRSAIATHRFSRDLKRATVGIALDELPAAKTCARS